MISPWTSKKLFKFKMSKSDLFLFPDAHIKLAALLHLSTSQLVHIPSNPYPPCTSYFSFVRLRLLPTRYPTVIHICCRMTFAPHKWLNAIHSSLSLTHSCELINAWHLLLHGHKGKDWCPKRSIPHSLTPEFWLEGYLGSDNSSFARDAAFQS